ncbi:tetraprenyl-beta-curcumene synthase family protein [Lentibacillus daqui]|uniref:tetraprenyl-beta-curcumene synthase family protein n=1 Tax=Lentibacillus daqui TaxID=2911514 RepID=UPI0022B1ADF8|nr:tetraprenyl-beta-curcumene synthase family protein [Lentibacillus daqui]
MGNHVPQTAATLMIKVYRKIFPAVKQELAYWTKRARQIPDEELRAQALASIHTKRFHCQGGAVYALLAAGNWKEAIRFIVAYQTISDYLDNLCDRSTSLDPADFRLLHEAMADALTPDNTVKNYYKLRTEQADGAYLADLVRTCQQVVKQIPTYHFIQPKLLKLEQLYGDLQVHKHVAVNERIPRLMNWFSQKYSNDDALSWYEFAAASGSTLGIFCFISYALGGQMTAALSKDIFYSYFPNMQALHILLDYYIDQQEDEREGDLNFCSYYPSREKMLERFIYFIEQTNHCVQSLPNRKFHEMIHHGLVGLYLADGKVRRLDSGDMMTSVLLRKSGRQAKFFYWNVRQYHRLFG